MAKTITVKGTSPASETGAPGRGSPLGADGAKMILWEKDPAHPNGEIFITDDGKSYTVGETAAIKRLLHEGRLARGDASDVKSPSAPATGDPRKATREEADRAGQTEQEAATATVVPPSSAGRKP